MWDLTIHPLLAGPCFSLQSMWDLTIHPLRDQASSLVLVSLSPIDVGSHNPPPFRAKRPRWYSFPSPIDVGSHNPPSSGPSILVGPRFSLQSMWDLTIHPPSGPSVLTGFRSSLQSMWDLTIHPLLAGPCFSLQSMWDLTIHPLRDQASSLVLVSLSPIDVGSHNPPPFRAERPRWYSFPSPIDVGFHNPPSSGPSILVGPRFSLQSMWDLTIHPPSGPSVLASLRSSLQLMWDLTIHPVQG